MTDPTYHAMAGELALFKQLILDLDRCQHGRHAADPCFGCPDGNHGNPLIPPGTLIGTGLHDRIVVPPWPDRYNPANWRVPDNPELKDVARSAAHTQSLIRIGTATLEYYASRPTQHAEEAQNNLYRTIDEHRRQFPEQP